MTMIECLVTWFCYHMIAKPGNKTAAPSWPDPSVYQYTCNVFTSMILHSTSLLSFYIDIVLTLSTEDNQNGRRDIAKYSGTVQCSSSDSCATTLVTILNIQMLHRLDGLILPKPLFNISFHRQNHSTGLCTSPSKGLQCVICGARFLKSTHICT